MLKVREGFAFTTGTNDVISIDIFDSIYIRYVLRVCVHVCVLR